MIVQIGHFCRDCLKITDFREQAVGKSVGKSNTHFPLHNSVLHLKRLQIHGLFFFIIIIKKSNFKGI